MAEPLLQTDDKDEISELKKEMAKLTAQVSELQAAARHINLTENPIENPDRRSAPLWNVNDPLSNCGSTQGIVYRIYHYDKNLRLSSSTYKLQICTVPILLILALVVITSDAYNDLPHQCKDNTLTFSCPQYRIYLWCVAVLHTICGAIYAAYDIMYPYILVSVPTIISSICLLLAGGYPGLCNTDNNCRQILWNHNLAYAIGLFIPMIVPFYTWYVNMYIYLGNFKSKKGGIYEQPELMSRIYTVIPNFDEVIEQEF